METQQVLVKPEGETNHRPQFDIDRGKYSRSTSGISLDSFAAVLETKTTISPFLFLSVDLPPPPLFQDAVEKNIIPQASLASVLAKYDGRATKVSNLISEHAVRMLSSAYRNTLDNYGVLNASAYHLILYFISSVLRRITSWKKKIQPLSTFPSGEWISANVSMASVLSPNI